MYETEWVSETAEQQQQKKYGEISNYSMRSNTIIIATIIVGVKDGGGWKMGASPCACLSRQNCFRKCTYTHTYTQSGVATTQPL